MIKCTHCGNENDEMARFCGNCGAELQSSAAQKKDNQTEGALSSGETVPVYEKIDSSNQNEIKQEGGKIGFSIASLVCGILSIIFCCSDIFGFILAVAAVVLGIIVLRNKYDGKGMAIAGIITGGIGFLISGILLLGVGASRFLRMINIYPENFPENL